LELNGIFNFYYFILFELNFWWRKKERENKREKMFAWLCVFECVCMFACLCVCEWMCVNVCVCVCVCLGSERGCDRRDTPVFEIVCSVHGRKKKRIKKEKRTERKVDRKEEHTRRVSNGRDYAVLSWPWCCVVFCWIELQCIQSDRSTETHTADVFLTLLHQNRNGCCGTLTREVGEGGGEFQYERDSSKWHRAQGSSR